MTTSVFVTGTTGFIGGGVARAFRQEGYRVYGLIRGTERVGQLLKDEIIPVIGEMGDVESYKEIVQKCSIIVDCVGGVELNKQLFEVVVAASQPPAYPKTYVYTSGILVYGDYDGVLLDETSECKAEAFAPRAAFDQRVIGEERVRGIVMRPGFLYGHGGSYTSMFVPPQQEGHKLVIKGNRHKRWAWVHLDDLCRAYVLAAVHSYKAKGQIFNVGDHSAPTFEELYLAFAKAYGWKGEVEYQAEPGDDFIGRHCEVSCVANPKKLHDFFGWAPKHLGLLAEVDLYAAALKAHAQ
ncbi:Epimerase domain-containing protein [Balamuthia mandrillaris]